MVPTKLFYNLKTNHKDTKNTKFVDFFKNKNFITEVLQTVNEKANEASYSTDW